MDIHVTRLALRQMETAARAALPNEACGILLGEGDRIRSFVEADNVHASPQTHFEIDPAALISAHRAARLGGPQVVGYFHSHPAGPAQPSATDIAMAAADGSIWAIYGTVQGPNAGKKGLRFYRAPCAAGDGAFAELFITSIES